MSAVGTKGGLALLNVSTSHFDPQRTRASLTTENWPMFRLLQRAGWINLVDAEPNEQAARPENVSQEHDSKAECKDDRGYGQGVGSFA